MSPEGVLGVQNKKITAKQHGKAQALYSKPLKVWAKEVRWWVKKRFSQMINFAARYQQDMRAPTGEYPNRQQNDWQQLVDKPMCTNLKVKLIAEGERHLYKGRQGWGITPEKQDKQGPIHLNTWNCLLALTNSANLPNLGPKNMVLIIIWLVLLIWSIPTQGAGIWPRRVTRLGQKLGSNLKELQ